MNRQKGPTVEPRELYSMSCDKPSWKIICQRICVCVCVYRHTHVYVNNFAVDQKEKQYC